MENPLISIVICCYNRAELLPYTLESALSQQYKPIEIIVYDDGSIDNTEEIVKKYKGKVSYYKNRNQGIAIARTNACQLAKGEYIAFLDDDDLMPAKRITILSNALKKYKNAVFSVGDWEVIDEKGKKTGYRWLPDTNIKKNTILFNDGYEAVMWPRVPAAPHTTLFKKVDGFKVGWFDTQYLLASEDKDFFAKLGQLGPVVYVSKVVSYYRVGHSSLTSNNITAAYNKLHLLINHLALPAGSDRLKKRLKTRVYKTLHTIARLECATTENCTNRAYRQSYRKAMQNIGIEKRLFIFIYKYLYLHFKKAVNLDIREKAEKSN